MWREEAAALCLIIQIQNLSIKDALSTVLESTHSSHQCDKYCPTPSLRSVVRPAEQSKRLDAIVMIGHIRSLTLQERISGAGYTSVASTGTKNRRPDARGFSLPISYDSLCPKLMYERKGGLGTLNL